MGGIATAAGPLYPSRMRAFLIGAACLLAPPAAGQSPPAVSDILRQVQERYANARQYRFAVNKSGEETGFLQIAVRKPDQFHFEADGRVIDGADAFHRVTMVSNGSTAWNYLGEPRQYTRKKITLPLLDTEPPAVTPETFVLQADTVFLSRYAAFATTPDHARFLRQETIAAAGGRTECYVIEFQAPLPGYRDNYTWWVDKQRYLVLREDTQPASSRRPASSVVYTVAAIDEPLPDDLFHFAPPAGARQVDQLEP